MDITKEFSLTLIADSDGPKSFILRTVIDTEGKNNLVFFDVWNRYKLVSFDNYQDAMKYFDSK